METLTFDQIKQLFIETREQFKETEKLLKEKSLETDRKFQETDRRFKEIHEELGGIGKSNGAIAEDFFFTALENSMQVGKLKFDYIDTNFRRKRNNVQGQYDVILYNSYKVLIVEVKYNFKRNYLLDFYKNIKNFKILFPEYSEYKIYGAIAGMTIEEDAVLEAKEFGFYILTQNNQNVQILNDKDFEPNAIK